MTRFFAIVAVAFFWAGILDSTVSAAESIDFNRDIRPILSNQCFKCHGPDPKERKGGIDGLRLDTLEGAIADLGSGTGAIVPGKPDQSELIRRITSTDADEAMPPPGSGKQLTPRDIERLKNWVQQGAPYAKHWSYVKPTRPALPAVTHKNWPKNPIDFFLLARLEREGLKPSPEADRYALARRAALDLTGLPPSVAEADRFANDTSADAYEQFVDRLLEKEAFGEHWARIWLDLARYADSAGYADDPLRTIWAYRDYVIRSFNANKPFDQFTIEQIAGDMLPSPTEDQLVATAFHRNTLTNSEGGTNDEEFRTVAIVDRVNTTWAVWLGTSMACAQCHTHKYEPLSQVEYFRFYAILNNTEDADRRDESPLLEFFTDEQKQKRTKLQQELDALERVLKTSTPELLASLEKWEQAFPKQLAWQALKPESTTSQGGAQLTVQDNNTILVANGQKTDVYTITVPVEAGKLSGVRLEALPHESLPNKGPGNSSTGNFIISRVLASIAPPQSSSIEGRYVRITLPGKEKILSLAEAQIFSGSDNVAAKGAASQSSTAFDGEAKRAIDGNTNGNYFESNSVTHTAASEDPWWEVDLKTPQKIERIVLWNRTDGMTDTRLADFRIAILNDQKQLVWEQTVKEHPKPSAEFATTGVRPVVLTAAFSDTAPAGFEPALVIKNPDVKKKGWAIGSAAGAAHTLTLTAAAPVDVPAGSKLTITIEQLSQQENHTLGSFRLSMTGDARIAEYSQTPQKILAILNQEASQRTEEQRRELSEFYFATLAPELKSTRDKRDSVTKRLNEIKANTVPIMRELASDKQRQTRIQFRGNFLDLGDEVQSGVPAVFHPLPENAPANRMTMAKWLVDSNNPLTARVLANRFWEQIFGIGLVRTSEEFGSQGELPSNPELLDWLAVEFIESKWNMKQLLKLMVTSAAYRQTSKVTPELLERDPDNRLLARGPRFRLSAEMVRDQALSVSGLLSTQMYGPSVKPPQPALGLSAAFGSTIDWKTSEGSNRYRRGLYTEWRRSNPYPSMVTFDAPNREVCTIRRNRTNTPLQALVTLNDPVYVECAQALARQMAQVSGSAAEKLTHGFRICLTRPPYEPEIARLVQLFEESRARFAAEPEQAKQMALGTSDMPPQNADISELAAWTIVANVMLNLDEMLMKR
jgi:hypothetical protein